MILAFGEFELDEELYALRHRGRPVKLEPKVFDVLVFLLRHRARVVTKEQLLDALWPGEAVSESVLPRCIAAAVFSSGAPSRSISTTSRPRAASWRAHSAPRPTAAPATSAHGP